jgi:hypothetical protein
VSVESWRVVTNATSTTGMTSDAIVRLRAGTDRLLVTGEGTTADDALRSALQTPEVVELGLGLGLAQPEQPATNLTVIARHEQGLVARLAVLLNAFEVTAFSYRVDPAGRARVDLMVLGGETTLLRAAARLRRVVGVERVTRQVSPDGE